MAEVTDYHRERAAGALGLTAHTRLSFESMARIDGTARLLAEVEEEAVYDFLQWLAPQGIVLADDRRGPYPVPVPEGELWEQWKTERHL